MESSSKELMIIKEKSSIAIIADMNAFLNRYYKNKMMLPIKIVDTNVQKEFKKHYDSLPRLSL